MDINPAIVQSAFFIGATLFYKVFIKTCVSIHSFATNRLSDFFPNVAEAEDGEWWNLSNEGTCVKLDHK